ncbi:DUF559 domain-containing protein [Arthrobacter sp. AL12]|uniref:DUF559 domain-containing protein n=1 Tax=Arthrobacter sp. AL12 TaxID=3042241 RepID=UPI00249B51F8|nr:DUF559 domain-containing protein [Arthrobacter sp. AL12]MDI3212105.1 DUF559 domain-containing protein [Arthrobacter sp. AL12]
MALTGTRFRGIPEFGDVGGSKMLLRVTRHLPRAAARLLEGTLIVELDGRHHGEWVRGKKDQRRNNVSVVQGYSVLRYYDDDVVHHSAPMLAAEVLAVLGRSPGPV